MKDETNDPNSPGTSWTTTTTTRPNLFGCVGGCRESANEGSGQGQEGQQRCVTRQSVLPDRGIIITRGGGGLARRKEEVGHDHKGNSSSHSCIYEAVDSYHTGS
jgi:hypothetical protein